MVADKHPPKPEDVPEDDVPEDDDGVDEELNERQETVRYNQILRQGSFFYYYFEKVFLFFGPPLFTLTFSK